MKMTNFEAWLKEADMPEKVNGQWVDLETGLAYDPKSNYLPTKTELSKRAMDGRKTAKSFGGKALAGSKKQKEWAEKIRAEKLMAMDQDQAKLACRPDGLGKHSKFWIENRGRSGKEIGEFFTEQTGLLAQAQKLQAKDKIAEFNRVAKKYNDLTDKWGF
jgi:hypothetical protein